MRLTLEGLKPGTAEYVLMHAVLRKRRGKKACMSYKDERNPRKALLLAQTELQHYASLDQWREQVALLRKGYVDYEPYFKRIRQELRACSFTLEAIGLSKKKFKSLRKKNAAHAAHYWHKTLGLLDVEGNKEVLGKLRTELSKGRMTLADVDTTEEILQLLSADTMFVGQHAARA